MTWEADPVWRHDDECSLASPCSRCERDEADRAAWRAAERASGEYRWASEHGTAGMPHPEELAYLGYVKVRQHPMWPSSWLMRRDVTS